jgi:hypothetical protein
MQGEVFAPVESSPGSNLCEPGTEIPTSRVEQLRLPEYLQKGVLYEFLGFAGIAQNANSDSEHQATVAVKKLAQCGFVARLNKRHQTSVSVSSGLSNLSTLIGGAWCRSPHFPRKQTLWRRRAHGHSSQWAAVISRWSLQRRRILKK